MVISRRGFHCRAGLAVAGLVAGVSGCALFPPEPVPLVPFRDFSLTTTGGVAGIFRQLRIGADGIGLVLSDEPAAGRVGPVTVDRLRTLLESTDLRRDIARLRSNNDPPRCADTFSTTLRMGELEVTKDDTCADVDTPALDELGRIVRPFWDGTFELPLPDESPLPPIVVQKVVYEEPTSERIEIDPSGTATLIIGDRAERSHPVEGKQLDTLRVLTQLPLCVPDRPAPDEAYLVRIGDQKPAPPIGRYLGPDCPELATIVHIAFDAIDR